jgi:hypothetical protein
MRKFAKKGGLSRKATGQRAENFVDYVVLAV